MPIFEYECSGCGHQFEFLVLPTSAKPSCPKCKGKKLQQMISLFSPSSDSTKANALREGRRRNKKIGKEMAHEEHKEFHKHHDDH